MEAMLHRPSDHQTISIHYKAINDERRRLLHSEVLGRVSGKTEGTEQAQMALVMLMAIHILRRQL